MKKLTRILLLCLTLLSLMPSKVQASHAAGAELVYTWQHDSTYLFYYHFYRDCSGIPQPDSVIMCYQDNCTMSSPTSVWLTPITGTLPTGDPNGTQVLLSCPGKKSTCDSPGSNLPGYQEWWYSATVTLPEQCNFWTFNCSISARNPSDNISGGDLYTEATLDNLDAQGNSSPYFTVKPVPYICNHIPYTYNNGAFDINNDSLSYEFMNPMNDAGGASPSCPGYGLNIPYNSGYSLAVPLLITGSFKFSSTTGQMSFTPNGLSKDAVAVRVHEWRRISGIYLQIGTVMRDVQVQVIDCSEPQPTLYTDTLSVAGAAYDHGIINACATHPFSFCFDAASSNKDAVLVVEDNSAIVTPKSVMTYTGVLTDSVHGCFAWTPPLIDTGLKVVTITIKDSNCKSIAFPISQTYSIPIYVWPRTKAFSDTAICPGDTAHLRAVGGGGFVWGVVPGGSPLSSLSCDSCANPQAFPTVSTKYWVKSTRDTYCKDVTDTVLVIVVPPPQSVVQSLTTCVHDSLFLKIPDTSGPYITRAIKWTPASFLSSDTIDNPVCKPLASVTYIVKVTYNKLAKCQSVDTVKVRYLKGFTLFNGDTSVCKNTPIKINAIGDTAYSYVWAPDTGVSNPTIINPVITPDTNITYTLTASYPGCTDSFKTISIRVEPVPLVSAGGARSVCSGDTVHLTPTVNPSFPDYTYAWTPAASVNNSTILDAIFIDPNTTTLTLTVTTPDGCKGADNVTITTFPVNFLKPSADTSICPGDTAHLSVSGDSLKKIRWSPGGFLSDTDMAATNAYPPTSTMYTIAAENTNLCRDTAHIFVTVKPAAVIYMPDSITLYPGDSYQISPSGNCLYFSWFPPLGLTADTISNPTAHPDVNTRYIVTGTTEAGCKAKDSIDIYIASDSYINIPNAFSPGTGPDNVLKVLHAGIASLKDFTIYNRWGLKVFETKDISQGWDGTYQGQPQPMGVYVYVVEAYSYKGKKFYKQGNVSLLR